MKKYMFFVRFSAVLLAVLISLNSLAAAQEATPTPPADAPKEEKKKEEKPQDKKQKAQAVDPKNLTAEQVAEGAILIYGYPSGRLILNQIRRTTIERGKLRLTDAQGKNQELNYQRWIIRGDALDKEKNRFEQDFPNARYSMIYDGGGKIFGLFNDSTFEPREDAVKTFQNQIWHGLEALLRYKENDSKLTMAGREKMAGVDYFLVDVTDKQNRKTRFYISSKKFQVKMLDYESNGVNYRRRFYDYNYSQGTLVPYRSVLWAGDKQIEETEVGTITFGQKVEENMFQGS